MESKINIYRNYFYLICLIILCQIIFLKPFFGLMDDATHLFVTVPGIQKSGLINHIIRSISIDAQWGMIRPVYTIMAYTLYSVGKIYGPIILYLFNAVLVLLILYLHAAAISKILKYDNKIKWLILIVTLAFPYTYDLFQHPSLQEKLIILFGALALYISMTIGRRSVFKSIMLFFILCCGYFSKPQFVIYFPLILLTQYAGVEKKKTKWVTIVISSLMNFIFMGSILYFIIHGGYTSNGFSVNKITNNIKNVKILILVCITFVNIFLNMFYKINNHYEKFIPAIGILSFLVIFAGWGYPGYLLSLISQFAAILILQMVFFMKKSKMLIVMLMLAALVVSIYRPYKNFKSLNDIGNIVRLAKSYKLAGISEINVFSMEGASSLEKYFQFYGKANIKVNYCTNILELTSHPVFFDQSMCPLPFIQWREYVVTYIYKSRSIWGYNLANFECR